MLANDSSIPIKQPLLAPGAAVLVSGSQGLSVCEMKGGDTGTSLRLCLRSCVRSEKKMLRAFFSAALFAESLLAYGKHQDSRLYFTK